MSEHKHDYNVKISIDKEKNLATIEGEMGEKEFAFYVDQEIKALKKEAELPGFRKGTAPEKMIIEKVGMQSVLHNAAEEALMHLYPHILDDEKIDAIGRPDVSITKIAKDNPLGFKISVSVMPEIKDFDYQSVAKKNNQKELVVPEVTEKEVDDVIENIKNSRKGEKEFVFDDAFIKTLGDFKDVADFKNKIKENIGKEKEYKEGEKKRIELFEALVKEASIKVPEPLVSAEQDRMLSEFKNNVSRMGVTWEDYIKHSKKTEEEMKKEWHTDALKRASIELILDYISKKEEIKPDETKVKEEVDLLLSHHEDLDPFKANMYVSEILARQAVIEFLEKLN